VKVERGSQVVHSIVTPPVNVDYKGVVVCYKDGSLSSTNGGLNVLNAHDVEGACSTVLAWKAISSGTQNSSFFHLMCVCEVEAQGLSEKGEHSKAAKRRSRGSSKVRTETVVRVFRCSVPTDKASGENSEVLQVDLEGSHVLANGGEEGQ
jgi:hypothetical protein